MADFGINEEGFLLKRLADVQDSLQTSLEAITDENGETLQINFDEDDPWIQSINVLIANNASTWEALQATYNQFNPKLATKSALSGLVQLNALSRRAGVKSTIGIDIVGTASTVIPAGQQVSDAQQNVIYVTDTELTIGGGGTVSGTASSQTVGAFLSLSGTITTILTPVTGWDSVTNPLDSVQGSATENDEQLRVRREKSTETPSVAPVEAVFGNLSQLEGVTFARVLVNNTLAVDVNGLPGKSIGAVVQGGVDADIADALFLRSPAGMLFHGNQAVPTTLTDVQGESYVIDWITPTDILIDVEVDITITDANAYPSDGDTQIIQAIIDYANGGAPALGIDTGFEDLGFVPGEDVILSRLFTPVNSVPGHTVTRLEISLSPAGVGSADLPIAFDEVSFFQSANITVTVT